MVASAGDTETCGKGCQRSASAILNRVSDVQSNGWAFSEGLLSASDLTLRAPGIWFTSKCTCNIADKSAMRSRKYAKGRAVVKVLLIEASAPTLSDPEQSLMGTREHGHKCVTAKISPACARAS